MEGGGSASWSNLKVWPTSCVALVYTGRKHAIMFHVDAFPLIINVKVKVKVTLVQALRLCTGRTAHMGSRGIAVLFHDHGTRRG